MRITSIIGACVLSAALAMTISAQSTAGMPLAGTHLSRVTTLRTENFPRPPYSGATYYIYERNNEIICTKLSVCNKFGKCSTLYKKGSYKDESDVQTGDPYAETAPIVISSKKQRKHVCLTRFRLVK